MAGDLYIETLSGYDIENIEKRGGQLEQSVFHADKDTKFNFTILDARLVSNVQNRNDLPPHCYITFDSRNIRDKIEVLRLSSILQRTSRPLGIVKNKASLNNWAQLSDVQKAQCLWDAIQNGPIKLEFYKVGLHGVKTYFSSFNMVDE